MSEGRDRTDAHSAADSLRTDFERLIEVFDRQLAALTMVQAETRSHIEEARQAAARGLELSRQLASLFGQQD